MTCCLALATGIYGGVQGGAFARFFQDHGSIQDIVARGLGFDIAAITITGQRELLSNEVLALAGIKPADSLILTTMATGFSSPLWIWTSVMEAAEYRWMSPT